MIVLQLSFQIWTAKEAILKATSLGLALELSEVEIGLAPLRVVALEKAASAHGSDWQLAAFRPGESYRGTLAGAVLPRNCNTANSFRPRKPSRGQGFRGRVRSQNGDTMVTEAPGRRVTGVHSNSDRTLIFLLTLQHFLPEMKGFSTMV